MGSLTLSTADIQLNNGTTVPSIGFGTNYKDVGERSHDTIVERMLEVIEAGYRFLDCGFIYQTEAAVGEAIRKSGVPRSEFFILTKFWNDQHGDPAKALDDALARLETDYVDMFMMHWPMASQPGGDGKSFRLFDKSLFLGRYDSPTFVETYQAMEKLVGPKCRALGVSNMTQKTLDELLSQVTIKPVMNEIDVQPLNPCLNLVPYCQMKGIQVVAWAPIGGGPPISDLEAGHNLYGNVANIYENPVLNRLANKYNVNIVRIILAWHVGRKVIPIPMSTNRERLEMNLRLPTLTGEEIKEINSIKTPGSAMRNIEVVKGAMETKPGKGKTFFGWTYPETGWEDEKGNLLI